VHKIKVIIVDALFTLFVPKDGMSRYEMSRRIIERLTGRDANIDKVTLIYDEKRALWEEKLPPDHGKKWSIIDREIIRALFPDMAFDECDSYGTQMATEILTDPSFYEVLPDTWSFLSESRNRRMRVVIGSNNDLEKLIAMVSHFGLSDLLYAVYASTEVGYEKPDPDFFRSIAHRERVRPEECIMIGNNPKNDVEGPQQAGLQAVLYDRRNEYCDFTGYRVSSFKDVLSLDIF